MNITNSNTLFNYNHINMDDIIHGNNEWKHIQPIIRTTLRVLFDVVNNQQNQISMLTSENTKLRNEISTKPNVEDIAELLKREVSNADVSKFQSQQPTSNKYIMHEIENINNNFIAIKTELEKKASIRYVDDNTKRKADKTDVMMLQASQKNNQYVNTNMSKLSSDMCQIENDLNDVKSKCYLLDKTMQEAHSKLNNAATVQDMTHVRDDLLEALKHTVTKEKFHLELNKKLDTHEMHTKLTEKADAYIVLNRCDELERAVTEHERLITLMQMKSHVNVMNEDGLGLGLGASLHSPLRGNSMGMHSPTLNRSGGGFGFGLGSHHKYHSSNGNTPTRSTYNQTGGSRRASPKGHRNAASHGSQYHSHSSSDESHRQTHSQTQSTLPDHLREGRENGVLAGLLEHVDTLGHLLQRVLEESRINGDRISGVEDQLADHTVPLHSYHSLQSDVKSLTQHVEQISSGEILIRPVEDCVHYLFSSIRQLEYLLDIPVGDVSCSYLKNARNLHQPLAHGVNSEGNLTVSQHLEDIHSLIELLGTRTTQHSATLDTMVLKHENYDVLHAQTSNYAALIDENCKAIKRLGELLKVSENKLNIGNMDEIVQYIHNLFSTIRKIQNETGGTYEKMLSIENKLEIEMKNEIEAGVVKVKKMEQRIESVEEKNVKIIHRLRSFRDEMLHIDKRVNETLMGVTSIINETASTAATVARPALYTGSVHISDREIERNRNRDPGLLKEKTSPTLPATAAPVPHSVPVADEPRTQPIGETARRLCQQNEFEPDREDRFPWEEGTEIQVDMIEQRLKTLQREKEKILQAKRSHNTKYTDMSSNSSTRSSSRQFDPRNMQDDSQRHNRSPPASPIPRPNRGEQEHECFHISSPSSSPVVNKNRDGANIFMKTTSENLSDDDYFDSLKIK